MTQELLRTLCEHGWTVFATRSCADIHAVRGDHRIVIEDGHTKNIGILHLYGRRGKIFEAAQMDVEKLDALLAEVPVLSKRPWNYGKRKPIEEDGELWCNCNNPKLTPNAGGRGQAFCLLCGYPWYH